MPKPLICALIVGACVALDIACHAATAGFLPLPADFEGGVLVRRFGFGPVALAWAIIAFSGMALVTLAGLLVAALRPARADHPGTS